MAIHVRRRDLIATLGGAATWPLAMRAQRPAVPVVGFLSSANAGGVPAVRIGIPSRAEGDRLCGGSQCSDRISLGAGRVRSRSWRTKKASRLPSWRLLRTQWLGNSTKARR
jgi:hypothetical protein